MTKTKGIIYGVLICLVLGVLWIIRHRADKHTDGYVSSPTLAPTDQEKLIVNQHSHTITIVKRGADGKIETHKEYAPQVFAVSENKNGDIKVESRNWGTDINPTVGFALGGDIRLRASLGLNVFYVYRWEAGAAVLLNSDIRDTRAMLRVGYNVYDNILVSVGYDTRRTPHLDFSFKF